MNNKVDIQSEPAQLVSNKKYLIVSNVKRRKNIELAIRAFKGLQNKGYQLYIAGHVEDAEYFDKLMSLKGKLDSIHFIGKKNSEDLNGLFNSTEGIIHPSFREGAANVILEAMASGTPVLATNCDYGPSEIITDGYNGKLVASENCEELTNAINNLLNDAKRMEKFKLNGAKTVKKYSIKNIARKYELLYSK